jgi:hypothetical protein
VVHVPGIFTHLQWSLVPPDIKECCIRYSWKISNFNKSTTYIVLRIVWNPIDFQGQGVKSLLCNILVNTLESTSFNGFWPDLDLWPWKSIGFQTLLRTKYVPSLVKIHWRMLILQCSQGCYAVKIWSGDLDLWPWKSIGQGHWVIFLSCNILVNTLESTSFNGFWPNLVHT